MEKKQKAKAAAYSGTQPGQNPVKNILKEVRRRKLLFLMLLPAIVFFIIPRSVPARKRFCAAGRVYTRQPERAFPQFSRIPAPVFPTGIGRFVQNTVRFL